MERSGSNVRGIVFPQLSLGKGKGKLAFAVDRIDRRILRKRRNACSRPVIFTVIRGGREI